MNIWKRYSMRVSKNWVKFNKMFTLSPWLKILFKILLSLEKFSFSLYKIMLSLFKLFAKQPKPE